MYNPERIWRDGDGAWQIYAKVEGKYENLIDLAMKMQTEFN